MKLLRQEVVLALLRVERSEEPEFVFRDRAADVEAGVNFREAIRRRADERKLLGLTDETLGAEVSEGITVKFVTAALGDNVENSTRAATIFRTVGAGLDFNFLHELEGKVRTRTTERGVGSVNTVEDVVVLRTGGTGD